MSSKSGTHPDSLATPDDPTNGVVSKAEHADAGVRTQISRMGGLRAGSRDFAVGAVTAICVVGLWEWLTATHLISTLFLPSPDSIVRAGISQIDAGQLWANVKVSGEEFALGLGLAVACGIPLGVVIGWSRVVRSSLWPLVMFLNAVPFIALTPLFILILGIGMASKVALVFAGGLFVLIINTATGVRNLDPDVLLVARSLGASRTQMFRTIALPGSLPYILVGLRLGISLSLIGIVVGELVGAKAGIGLMIANAGQTFQVPVILLGVMILGIASVCLTAIVSLVERRFQGWRLSS